MPDTKQKPQAATSVSKDTVPVTAGKPVTASRRKVPVAAKLASGKTVTVLMDADDVVKDQVGGFITFVREHAIVGLAIGFIIGAQAQAVIKQLVDSFIAPLLVLIFGGSFKNYKFTIGEATFLWGAMVYALINLVFVLIAIYLLLKIFKLDKLDKPKDKSDAAAAKDAKKAKRKTKKTTKAT